MVYVTQGQKWREQGKQDGAKAAILYFNEQKVKGKPKEPINIYGKPELYGFVPVKLNRRNPEKQYQWGWENSFSETCQRLMREYYKDTWLASNDTMVQNNLVSITPDIARRILGEEDVSLWMQCHHCGRIHVYAGYPQVPESSTSLCLNCGNLQVGGYLFMDSDIVKRYSLEHNMEPDQ